MEAAGRQREIEGDRAQRIVDAMRASVARRGVAASTFDHVAREAGVSRGLLHYHFGTKERLLAEVVRRDADLRLAVLEARLARARTAGDVVALLVAALDEMVRDEPEQVQLAFELFTLSRRNEEVAAELRETLRRARDHVASALAAKQAEGILRLRAEPAAVAEVLFALSDGIALRLLAEPDADRRATVRAAVAAVRALLDDADAP
ncbi:MAG TPA: TetR family transcriptional regulator [Solirubrobacteraceae bacterium]|nr:TetR family transcriptional regulator [Solirubrobacteraceae bacterium]